MRSDGRQSKAWPSELQQLLLRAALLDGDEALDAWERSKHAASEVQRLDEASYRLLPLLYRNLVALGVEEPLMEKLKGVYRHSWYCNQRLFHESAELLRELEAAGIPTLVLKGAALSTLYYSDAGARPMEDLDVLVPTALVRRAAEVLHGSGWRHDPALDFEKLVRTTHAAAFVNARERSVDLHWYALWQPGSDHDFWEAAIPFAVGGAPTRALCPSDQLFQVCVHGVGLFPGAVRWVADAVILARRAGDQLDWGRVVQQAAARRLTVPLAEALGYLKDAFALPAPEIVLDRLAAAPTTRSERLAHAAAQGSGRFGSFYPVLWDRYRRLRTLDHEGPVPTSFSGYLADVWNLPSRRHLVGRVARKAFQIARHGVSDPSGRPVKDSSRTRAAEQPKV